VYPVLQLVQAVAPMAMRPVGHAVHAPAPAPLYVLLALPHGVHMPEPSAGAYVPDVHVSQAVAASMPPVLEPTAHATQVSSS
jgi:hypothetical protein